MINAIRAAFVAAFGTQPDVITRAPGRVNLIGEHTDYNDGFVLPCAISYQTMVAIRKREDGVVNIIAEDLEGARNSLRLDQPILPDAEAPWSNYVRGMIALMQQDGFALPGADITILGNMPQGAGLSSSAALENAIGLAYAALIGRADIDRNRLAELGQLTEHRFAGCNCGIMDQLVSARAEAGAALLIDCRTLTSKPVAIPVDVAIMIVHSGVSRGLVDGAYNERREQCENAAAHYGVKALRDLDVATLNVGQAGLDPIAFRRARHVVTENQRTLDAVAALATGKLNALGPLMAQSHISMRDDFEITHPAIDQLVAILTDAIGDEGGARMTGGGFGGSVVAIMKRNRVDAVSALVREHYQRPDGEAPLIMVETPAAGASVVTYW
jgi:galactokinase